MRLRALVGWSTGLGLGLGLLLGAGASYLAAPTAELANEAIIARARDLGMRPLTELAGAEVTLTVGPGTTVEQLAEGLQQSGLLNSRTEFLERVAGGVPKVGVFRLRSGLSLDELVKALF